MLIKFKTLGLLLALLLTLGAVTAQPAAAQSAPCDLSGTVDGTATPNSGTSGTTIAFRATGFTLGEDVSYYFTLPNGAVFGTARPLQGGVQPDGSVLLTVTIPQAFTAFPGTWALTVQGATSNHVSIIKFCVTTTAQPPAATATTAPATATSAPAATDTPAAATATTAPAATETATTAPTVAASETATTAPTTAPTTTPTVAASETATTAPTTAATAVASATATTAPTQAATAVASATATTAPTQAPIMPPTVAPAPPTVAPPPMLPPAPAPTPIYGGGVQPGSGGQPPGMPRTGQADTSGLLLAVLLGLSLCSFGLLVRRRVAVSR